MNSLFSLLSSFFYLVFSASFCYFDISWWFLSSSFMGLLLHEGEGKNLILPKISLNDLEK